jgi:hypothetical protein
VVNSAVWEKYLLDPIMVQAYNNRAPDNPVIDGMLRGIAGFEALYEYPALPATGNMTGFQGCKSSTIYVGRVPKNPQEIAPGLTYPGVLRVISEPNSGLSVMMTADIDRQLVVHYRACWMYGVAKGDPKQGTLVKSA